MAEITRARRDFILRDRAYRSSGRPAIVSNRAPLTPPDHPRPTPHVLCEPRLKDPDYYKQLGNYRPNPIRARWTMLGTFLIGMALIGCYYWGRLG